MIDTHTADGLKVARERVVPGMPTIVLETALPAKFAETVSTVLGVESPVPSGFEGLASTEERVVTIEADPSQLAALIR